MAPVSQGADMTVADSQPVADHMMDVFFGEEITSIRQMIKRYCFHDFTPLGNNSRKWKITKPDFPAYCGFNPGSLNSGDYGGGSLPFSFTQCTYLNYFSPAFVAYRGGIRWKKLAQGATFNPGTDFYETNDHLAITRSSGVDGTNSAIPGGGAANNAYKPNRVGEALNPFREKSATIRVGPFMESFTTGGFVTPADRNPAVEVDLPFYSNRRFMCARRISNLEDRQIDDEMPPVHITTAIGSFTALENYCAAAEDFSLSFFIGAPVLYSVGVLGEYQIPIVTEP